MDVYLHSIYAVAPNNDIEIENLIKSYIALRIYMKITPDKMYNKLISNKVLLQAGAELCQAQVKLRLVGLWLDLCLI